MLVDPPRIHSVRAPDTVADGREAPLQVRRAQAVAGEGITRAGELWSSHPRLVALAASGLYVGLRLHIDPNGFVFDNTAPDHSLFTRAASSLALFAGVGNALARNAFASALTLGGAICGVNAYQKNIERAAATGDDALTTSATKRAVGLATRMKDVIARDLRSDPSIKPGELAFITKFEEDLAATQATVASPRQSV